MLVNAFNRRMMVERDTAVSRVNVATVHGDALIRSTIADVTVSTCNAVCGLDMGSVCGVCGVMFRALWGVGVVVFVVRRIRCPGVPYPVGICVRVFTILGSCPSYPMRV